MTRPRRWTPIKARTTSAQLVFLSLPTQDAASKEAASYCFGGALCLQRDMAYPMRNLPELRARSLRVGVQCWTEVCRFFGLFGQLGGRLQLGVGQFRAQFLKGLHRMVVG